MQKSHEVSEELVNEIRKIINDDGYAVVHILSPDGYGLAYTVGMTLKNMPEIVAAGPFLESTLTEVVNAIATRWLDSNPLPKIGVLSSCLEKRDGTAMNIELRAVDDIEAVREFIAPAADHFYGGLASYWQVTWPDLNGLTMSCFGHNPEDFNEVLF